MCNEHRRTISLETLRDEFSLLTPVPLFAWENDHTPNLDETDSVRIGDTAPVVRLSAKGGLVGAMTPWAWKAPNGKPVFNFRSEGRDFSRSDRVLIPADGFYEYTAPTAAKVKLKDKHLFTVKGERWFWIAGIVRDGAFSMLTTPPGPDVAPYHDRQIVTLAPRAGLDWLSLARPQGEILAVPRAGTLEVATLRRDGVDLAA